MALSDLHLLPPPCRMPFPNLNAQFVDQTNRNGGFTVIGRVCIHLPFFDIVANPTPMRHNHDSSTTGYGLSLSAWASLVFSWRLPPKQINDHVHCLVIETVGSTIKPYEDDDNVTIDVSSCSSSPNCSVRSWNGFQCFCWRCSASYSSNQVNVSGFARHKQ